MSEILSDYEYKKNKNALKGLISIVFYAAIFGCGLGAMLFSQSSLNTSFALRERINVLEFEIKQLNSINAKLQKDYFELLSIQGDYDN